MSNATKKYKTCDYNDDDDDEAFYKLLNLKRALRTKLFIKYTRSLHKLLKHTGNTKDNKIT